MAHGGTGKVTQDWKAEPEGHVSYATAVSSKDTSLFGFRILKAEFTLWHGEDHLPR